MKYRYTKFTGDALDDLDLEDLVSKLSDLLLSSGFGNPYAMDDEERTLQALHDAILDALFNGGVLPEETIERLLGVYADAANPVAAIVAYIAKPGVEKPGTSQEASEVRYFAADEIPWDEIAFPTAREALTDWVGARARAP